MLDTIGMPTGMRAERLVILLNDNGAVLDGRGGDDMPRLSLLGVDASAHLVYRGADRAGDTRDDQCRGENQNEDHDLDSITDAHKGVSSQCADDPAPPQANREGIHLIVSTGGDPYRPLDRPVDGPGQDKVERPAVGH